MNFQRYYFKYCELVYIRTDWRQSTHFVHISFWYNFLDRHPFYHDSPNSMPAAE